MDNTLLTLNKKINKELGNNTKTKDRVKQLGKTLLISLIFSMVFLTSSFHIGGTSNIGTIFIIPLLATIIQVNKKIGLITMVLITLGSLLFGNLIFLATSVSLIFLIFIAQFNLSKNQNIMLVIASAITSYLILNIINETFINPYFILFIIVVDYVMSNIYFQVIDIYDFNKSKTQVLFREEIHAILLAAVNISIGLYLINIGNYNIGFIFSILSVMIFGLLSDKMYTLTYTFIIYFILKYTGLTYDSVEIIPFIGIGSILFKKDRINMRTLYFLIIPAVLEELLIVRGSIIDIYISVLAATILYFIVAPRIIKKYSNLLVPKYEEAKYYRSYVENVREEMSNRLLHFAELFETFSNKASESNDELIKLDEAIDEVINKHCKRCIKKDTCLNSKHIKTYNYFTTLLKEGRYVYDTKKRFLDLFSMYCLHATELVETTVELNGKYEILNPNNRRKRGRSNPFQFQDSLSGMAKILQQYAIEVSNDFEDDDIKVERIKDQLRKIGVTLVYFKQNSLKANQVDIEIGVKELTETETVKILIPTITGFLKEDLELMSYTKSKGLNKIRIISKQMYEIDFGVKYVGKGGSRVCGDNYLVHELHNGNTVIALSDGMGSGFAAHEESKSTLELLNQMLKSGAGDYTAVSTINSLLDLKEYSERYSTLDYVTINKSLGSVEFYKLGAAPSFIVRGNRVIKINNENVMIGEAKQVNGFNIDIKVNDVIVIISDGAYEHYSSDKKFERDLAKIPKNAPMQIANDIIKMAYNDYGETIPDDMTAIVLKVNPKTKDAVQSA
ncbi:SpoIIE family protein phosphatase [Haloplasma contractile]|uniref:Serine phosphatase protein n=1 Tax=Haloplasma contractile SSD-17B TaxID=1033810 RepID=U2EBH8_9MOLU|nr:SpoIIE family protein phosphatase [Haloplasma contractile]ERJ12433.1 Serine phosphatase protein [Haloplasma contractile SSD-17B]